MVSTALEGALDIVAWPGYIERGETDKAYDWVTQFEADTGCKVNVKVAATSDEMVTLMTCGGPQPSPPGDASWPPPGNAPYDLVTASGDASLRLIRGGTVQPVDIEPRSELRQHRSAPAGSRVALRRRQALRRALPVGPERADVQHQARSRRRRPPGRWCSSRRSCPTASPTRAACRRTTGLSTSPMRRCTLRRRSRSSASRIRTSSTKSQYAAVLELLRGQHPLVQRYWHDANVQVQDFQNEGIVASGSWPFQVNTLLANKQPIATTVPAEGATGWADTTMLAAGAKHPNCAYKWLEWSISPKVQGDVAAWFGSNPVVPKACEGNELLGAEGCKNNGIENFDKIKFWRTPEAKCASHVEGCVPYNRWVTDYVAVMGGQ